MKMTIKVGIFKIETMTGFRILESDNSSPLYATLPFKPNEDGSYQLIIWDDCRFVGPIYGDGSIENSGSATPKVLMEVFCEKRDDLVRLVNEFTNYSESLLIGRKVEPVQAWRLR